jgi:NADPH2:quinone reductase
MAHAIRIHANGGPEVLKWEAVEVGEPGAGEVRLRQHAVGLNYIDVYHRSGLYKLANFPAIIGMEGAGTVEAVGPGVTDLKVGDRAAYAGVLGAYAVERLIAADRLVKLPDTIDDVTAAAMMLQGMTARYLLRETHSCTPETVLLYHAAAGGVGLIVCQWAKAIGATMIGTVGSDEKGQLAKAAGCTHVINYRTEDYVARVREITGGAGCDVVYDGVGKDTFPSSLDCLRPKGLWVSFGNASGLVPPLDMTLLSAKGSLYATRPTILTYIARREDLLANARELFDMVAKGAVRIAASRTYPLSEAAQAHRDLEARKTTGSVVLIA